MIYNLSLYKQNIRFQVFLVLELYINEIKFFCACFRDASMLPHISVASSFLSIKGIHHMANLKFFIHTPIDGY